MREIREKRWQALVTPANSRKKAGNETEQVMQVTKPLGRNASALKYDILSALGVSALSGDKHRQRLVLRLIVLITTRYNWQNNELSIGRTEIARLWFVNERTVKREIAKMRTAGWLEVKRAGVKGRVTVYALNIAELMRGTANVWAVIGSDFEDRMQERHGGVQDGAGQGDVTDPNVIPFQPRSRSTSAEDTWGRVLAQLHAEAPAQAATWFGQLSEMAHEGERVTLLAPSRFIANYVRGHFMTRILRGYVAIDPSIRQIEVVAAEE